MTSLPPPNQPHKCQDVLVIDDTDEEETQEEHFAATVPAITVLPPLTVASLSPLQNPVASASASASTPPPCPQIVKPVCPCCRQEFDTNMELKSKDDNHKLPIACIGCGRRVCYACLRKQLIQEWYENGNSNKRHVACVFCIKSDAFNMSGERWILDVFGDSPSIQKKKKKGQKIESKLLFARSEAGYIDSVNACNEQFLKLYKEWMMPTLAPGKKHQQSSLNALLPSSCSNSEALRIHWIQVSRAEPDEPMKKSPPRSQEKSPSVSTVSTTTATISKISITKSSLRLRKQQQQHQELPNNCALTNNSDAAISFTEVTTPTPTTAITRSRRSVVQASSQSLPVSTTTGISIGDGAAGNAQTTGSRDARNCLVKLAASKKPAAAAAVGVAAAVHPQRTLRPRRLRSEQASYCSNISSSAAAHDGGQHGTVVEHHRDGKCSRQPHPAAASSSSNDPPRIAKQQPARYVKTHRRPCTTTNNVASSTSHQALGSSASASASASASTISERFLWNDPRSILGKRMAKDFKGYGRYYGTIVDYFLDDNGEDVWNIHYDDNDDEDIGMHEVLAGLQYYNENCCKVQDPNPAGCVDARRPRQGNSNNGLGNADFRQLKRPRKSLHH